MDNFIRYISKDYYTDFIHFLVCIVALTVSIKLKDRHPRLKVFQFYFAGFIMLKVEALYLVGLNLSRINATISEHLDYLFTIFEYVCMAFFIKTAIESFLKNIVNLISLVFYILSGYLYYTELIQKGSPVMVLNTLYTLQAVCLITCCTLYYINLFKSRARNLTEEPAFWIVNGMVFFMLSTLPYSVLLNYIWETERKMWALYFSIFYIFYIIFFAMIIRGYLCKPKNQVTYDCRN
jgi:hypothetical protein